MYVCVYVYVYVHIYYTVYVRIASLTKLNRIERYARAVRRQSAPVTRDE